MKPRESYRVTAVWLVEFHNLGTTTVELPGHLFLLGDNGSGKTTLLDAIHLVLTAGREMEFKSAARVAGAKDSGGRTYQGVVLRYNAVTGRPARESGITYAALELKSSAGRVLSLAVGLAAEGMDVAIERWGGLAAVPVADLPLTIDEGGRLRAATAAEFKRGMSALTGGHAYAHINDYADAVGDRLFGGADKYADVCKLLRTGKAYREIAARAANYDELFRQLLEDPSRETFEPLLKGLRELEESKAVPNYLLILTVAEFLYHGGESSDPPKAAPLLFDEAFYGIDAARRDQLLAFAEDLGLQLFVSSPDQDGVKREIRHSVSLIVVKDENLDVHLSPVTWNNAAVQTGLFDGESPALGMTVGEETR